MFLFGILSLSDLIQPITSLYIEHAISNLIIPAYIYGAYLFYEVAIYDESWESWAEFGIWCLFSLYGYLIQRFVGIEAQYFLRMPSEDYEDGALRPSIFYWLGWAEHEPKQNDYYDNYY